MSVADNFKKIERGLIKPSINTMDKLIAFYGISIDEIVHYSKEQNIAQ